MSRQTLQVSRVSHASRFSMRRACSGSRSRATIMERLTASSASDSSPLIWRRQTAYRCRWYCCHNVQNADSSPSLRFVSSGWSSRPGTRAPGTCVPIDSPDPFGRGEEFKTLFPTLHQEKERGKDLPATFLKTELAGTPSELDGAGGIAADALPLLVKKSQLVAALPVFRLAGGVVEAGRRLEVGLDAEAAGVDGRGVE